MADNTENMSMGNFSIQDTMEMGTGSQELLNDLFAPETSTSNPDDVTPIIKEVTPEKTETASGAPKGKEVAPPEEKEGDSGKSLISSFLGGGDDEEEESTEDTPTKVTKKEETIKEENTEDEDEDAPKGTQFTALANDLFKLGVFNKDENEEDVTISTAEEFLERFNNEKRKGAIEVVDNFLNQFGEDYRNAFEAIFVKGADPKEYFTTYNSVVNFAEMDLSQEKNQVTIISQFMADQGFDNEDIETEIDRLRNYGDLETVATRNHKVLVKKEAQKLQEIEKNAELELQQKTHVRNQYINNVREVITDKLKAKEFDGIPLNPKLASELQDFLLVDKWKTPSGETLSDFDRTILDLKRPENHAMKVKVGLLLKILEKDPTLSTIQKTGVSKKTDELFSEVARQVTKSAKSNSTGGSSSSKTNSWFL